MILAGCVHGLGMRIHSSRVARILSKTRKPNLNLATQFEIPPSLYDRINKIPNNNSTQAELLGELFSVSKGSRQKALVGSLLLEHNVRLPIGLDAFYLKALVDSGYVSAALKLWRQRRIENGNELTEWMNLGVELLCYSHRMVLAEKFVAEKHLLPTIKLCTMFIRAYSELEQGVRCERWIDTMFALNPNVKQANNALRYLIRARIWPQVQKCVELIGNAGLKVSADLTSACILESAADTQTLISMLSQDGSLVNSSRFQRALNRDIRYQVDQATTACEAVELLRGYNGPHEVYLCYKVLKKYKNASAELLEKVTNSPCRSSIFLQFMLEYLRQTDGDLWSFILKYKLHTSHPTIQGDLTPENYYSLWKSIRLEIMKNQYTPLPVSLRNLALSTLAKSALTKRMMHQMIQSFRSVPDNAAIFALLEYAGDVCGIIDDWRSTAQKYGEQPIDNHFRDQLLIP